MPGAIEYITEIFVIPSAAVVEFVDKVRCRLNSDITDNASAI